MVIARGLRAVDRKELRDAVVDVLDDGLEFRRILGRTAAGLLAGEVIGDRVGQDEVAVGEALHERGGAEAVGAVVGEVGFAADEQAGDVGLQVIVHPEAAHRVVHGREDAHRLLVRVLAGDVLVHVEQVAVAGADLGFAEALDRGGEVEVDAETLAVDHLADAAAFVADFLGGAGGDVARGEVAVARVLAFEEIVAGLFGDFGGGLGAVGLVLRDPDAAVVAERLGHQGELGLVFAVDRNAGRVDLRVAGIGETGAAAVGAERRGDVATLGVGREVEDVAVAAGADHDHVGGPGFDGARDEVARDDALGLAVDEDEVEHLVAGVHLHRAEADLAGERGVGADEQLLAGLAAGVERARDLGAAEGTIGEEASVFTGERHALRDALVDDVRRDLREAVDVGFAGAVVAALDRVLEEAADAVAVVLVVLRGVDAALRGDRVGAARAVLVAETGDFIAHLGERGGGGGAGEAGTDHDDVILAAVGRIHQAELRLMVVPLVGQRAGGGLRIEIHGFTDAGDYFRQPVSTARGMEMKPRAMIQA